MTKLLPFDEIAQGPLDRRAILALRQDRVRSRATGRELLVDRVLVPDWVNVIAVTPAGEMLFVRQWRFGSCCFSLEIPAGAVEPGEDPLQAGLRELREETGYAPRPGTTAKLIGSVRPNAAFMNNRCWTVLCADAVVVGAPAPEPTEELELSLVPRGDVDALVRDGTIDSALVVVALHLLALHDASR